MSLLFEEITRLSVSCEANEWQKVSFYNGLQKNEVQKDKEEEEKHKEGTGGKNHNHNGRKQKEEVKVKQKYDG